jgi:hypothetical protein
VTSYCFPILRGCIALLLIATALAPLSAAAETMYVTDELRLGLYDNEQTKGKQVKALVSGDALEVLERSLMSVRVRTEAGDEGWVKTAYLVSAEPGRRRVATLTAENTKLQNINSEQAVAVTAAQSRIAQLEEELADARAGIEELPQLRGANAALEARLATTDTLVPLHWLLIVALITIVVGFAAGYYWLDRRVRRQFGGVRVY